MKQDMKVHTLLCCSLLIQSLIELPTEYPVGKGNRLFHFGRFFHIEMGYENLPLFKSGVAFRRELLSGCDLWPS